MSNKNTVYKYDAPVRHRTWGEAAISYIPFMVFLIIFAIKPPPPFFYIVGIILSVAIGSALSAKHNAITLFPRFFIIGDTVILYRNVVSLWVGGKSTMLRIKTKEGQQYSVEMKKFTSNARKSWKIKKHQKAKFDKVAEKILEKCSTQSPGITITIKDYPALASFHQN